MRGIAIAVFVLLSGTVRADAGWVRLAAANSAAESKAAADFVCTGTNDELTVQKAVDLCKGNGRHLMLSAGLYVLGSVRDFGDGGPRAAVCLRNMHREFALVGERRQLSGWPDDMRVNGVVLYLAPEALKGADGKPVDILRGEWSERGIMNGSALRLENIAVYAPDSQHPLRAVDLQRVCSAELHNEHVVLVNCSATFGLYGFTFGNYPYHCGFNHPITLINCCDEQNVNLPLFNSCGDDGGKIHGRQEVTMISFNCERVAEHAPGKKLGDLMREVRPGTWRGNISFTRQPRWHDINSVDEPIWQEDGSGSGFVTRNNAHKAVCGSAERRTYYPQLGQQVFDTDLNRLVICTDPKSRKWVDALGNEVK